MAARKKQPAKRKTSSPAQKASTKKKSPAKKKKLELSFEEKLAQAVADSDVARFGSDDAEVELWSAPKYHISTRNIALDKALGGKGLPGGRIIEVFGRPQSGKSTMLDQVIAEVQSMGGLAILIDSEQARDRTYMESLGIDRKRLVLCQVTTIEEVFEQMEYWATKGREMLPDPDKPVLVVWDSLGGTPTKAELETPLDEEVRVGQAARIIRRGMRRVVHLMGGNGTTVLIANQVYKSMARHGGTDKTSGGDGVPYHASVRIQLWSGEGTVVPLPPRGTARGDKLDPVGQIVWATVVKNKLAPPMAKCEFAIIFGHGVDNGYAIWNDNAGPKAPARDDAIINRSGSWFRISDDIADLPPWQGGHWGLNDLAAEHPDVWAKIVEAYRSQ